MQNSPRDSFFDNAGDCEAGDNLSFKLYFNLNPQLTAHFHNSFSGAMIHNNPQKLFGPLESYLFGGFATGLD
jgi:hypothetical protein